VPYLILSLPRSRTFWLSKLLACHHDPSRFFADRRAAIDWINAGHSGIDTALGLIWHDIAPALRHDLMVAVIHRPMEDVVASLERVGVTPPVPMLAELAGRLHKVAGMHLSYSQVETYDGCARLAYWCTGMPLDMDRWEEAECVPVECDRAAYRRDAFQNARGIAELYGREWVS
jgi:hypothetical protein